MATVNKFIANFDPTSTEIEVAGELFDVSGITEKTTIDTISGEQTVETGNTWLVAGADDDVAVLTNVNFVNEGTLGLKKTYFTAAASGASDTVVDTPSEDAGTETEPVTPVISTAAGSTTRIENVTFSGNAGGAIVNAGSMTIKNSAFRTSTDTILQLWDHHLCRIQYDQCKRNSNRTRQIRSRR